MVKNHNYITIQGWMVNELGISGAKLIIYATIFGFSQTEGTEFTGSAAYLAEWTGTSKRTIYNVLKSMVDDGLLIKRDEWLNDVKFCRYTAVVPSAAQEIKVVKKLHQGDEKTSGGVLKKLHQGDEKTSLYNIEDNIEDKLADNNYRDQKPGRSKTKKQAVDSSTKPSQPQKPTDVDSQVWEDFQQLRKTKRSPITQTALDRLRTEGKKAGLSLNDVLVECCANGWQGFKAGWVQQRNSNATNKGGRFTTMPDGSQISSVSAHNLRVIQSFLNSDDDTDVFGPSSEAL